MERWRKQASDRSTQNLNSLIKNPEIFVADLQSQLPLNRVKTQQLALSYLKYKSISYKWLSINFVSPHKIRQLHKRYFKTSSITDCISFPIDQDFLGEIFICPAAAIQYAPQAPYEEVKRYILHSLLHLIGFNDSTEEEKQGMRSEEDLALNLFKAPAYCLKP